MVFDWDQHKKHRAQVIADYGQWIGLLDADGVPIMDVPPVVELKAPQARNAPTSFECTINVATGYGVVHPIVDELVADNLGIVGGDGQLVPAAQKTRMIVVERPGERRAFKITHVVAKGEAAAPQTLTIHGVSMLTLLDMVPCPSFPGAWKADQWRDFERDEGAEFGTVRSLAPVEFAAIADGFTVGGPAETTIRKLIMDSLAAAYRVAGVKNNPPIVVDTRASNRPSPEVLIRPTDKSIWQEIQAVALAAGVSVTVDLWWPGDEQPQGERLSLPTAVVRVEQKG